MKNLIRFLSAVFVVATLLASLNYLWNYRQYYGGWDKKHDISDVLTQYKISSLSPEADGQVLKPKLPDISGYTVEAVEEKIPALKTGVVLVTGLKEAYLRVRKHLAFFGEMQDRLDPVSILIVNGVYNLQAVTKEVSDASIIEKREGNIYVLHVPLMVGKEATLLIQEGETLLMSSNHGALLTAFGDVFITKAEVKGWNTETDKPALYTDADSFRPHITAWCGSHLNIAKSKISNLGYKFSKAYGITYTSCTDTLYRDHYADVAGATGWIIDSKFHDIYFGFYSYESDDIVLLGNLYEDNIIYGIDPHDRSSNLIIAYNTVHSSREKHGIIISREVSHSFIFRNLTEGNAGSGIMLDRNSHSNIIAHNISQKNKQDGLTFYESPHNISFNNTLLYNGKTGMRIRNSWDIKSLDDVINYNGDIGIQLYSQFLDPVLAVARGGHPRDLKMDPYEQKAGVSVSHVEMVGNKSSNFKLNKFNEFKITNPQFFQSPKAIFSGDVKGIDSHVMGDLLGSGLSIQRVEAVE